MAVRCSRARAKLDCDAALTVAEPYFLAVREQVLVYEQRAVGRSKCKRVRLECAPWAVLHEEEGFGVRNYAATSDGGDLIVFAPELVELPPETVAAIFAHEFGHALDFLHPGRWMLVDDELVLYHDDSEAEERDTDRARVARMRQWRGRDRDCIEQTADLLGTEATGRVICYGGPCVLQTFRRGSPRPKGLR
jgi:hypothetical protein